MSYNSFYVICEFDISICGLDFAKIDEEDRKKIESYFENPFCIGHGIYNDETGQSHIGSWLRKYYRLRDTNVRFASKVFGIHVLPKFIGKPFRLGARGRICVEPSVDHPVTEILQMTITVPGITVQLQNINIYM